ncbi:reprolysin-like metallopeptidase [Lewinella sp. W8]|uniref:reprolysin-like metallopeptidase n=1 Tax=Lewinella sp. W8 TaxID=2528208 RepID=UPI001068BA32|nr:zinc-dependent metalloprotease family protein [Lewinella sp. W8]MTB50609.1 T9SS type A sorting domain-containing protein [Lewinella sp. W8]
MTRLLFTLIACCGGLLLSAQNSSFQFISSPTSGAEERTVELDQRQFLSTLKRAPREFSGAKHGQRLVLPLPTGTFAEFEVVNSPLIGRSIQERYPEINSYKVAGPWGGGRISVGPSGMSAVLRGPNGYYVIEPDEAGSDQQYRVIKHTDYLRQLSTEGAPLSCGYDDHQGTGLEDLELDPDMLDHGEVAGAELPLKAGNDPRELRIYDLVMTCTGEFAQRVGGDTLDVLEAFNTAVSTINGIFENEVGIRMNLLDATLNVIFLDPDNDPYSNANTGGALLGQVLPAFNDANIPPEAYDLGHIFTSRCTDVGGVVSGNACTGGKTRGVTCVGGSVVGAALRIMSHEVAHQFAVSHSWNNCPGSEGQRAGGAAFEPGSGTTIMSYAGACGNQNIGADDSYYHVGSLQQFLTFTRVTGARACATIVETDNFTPDVELDYAEDFFIPISTPFVLSGTATDANDDELTYNWEQFDLGPAVDIRDPSGNAPLFRSVPPSPDGNVRYFPRIDRIVNNISSLQEVLPTYSRDLTFRLVARDNNPEAGGVDWETMHFFAEETAGPFVVNDPVDPVWETGDHQEVTWDVANTDKAPVNCRQVDIYLSQDGGFTYSDTLARGVANNGRAFVTIPEGILTDAARIMVKAADNIFLNVNETDFTITGASLPTFTLEASDRYEQVCLPDQLSFDFSSGSVLGFSAPISLSVDTTGMPDGLLTTFSNDVINPGDNTTLGVDLSEVRFDGTLELTVLAVTPGLDTARRIIVLDVTDNDFSDLAFTAPAEGTSGIILSTDFDWTDAVNADSYEIQIATRPNFVEASIFEVASGLTETEYTPVEFFEPNTLYYWRIRPVNDCGPAEWTDPASFRTVNSQCITYSGEDTPIALPGTGPSFTRESSVFVDQQGSISDLNIPNIKMRYNFASKVTLTLTSPAGTSVVLYLENCFSTNAIDLGFDDDAPRDIVCPPDDQRVFVPVGSLADFNGEDTFGTWVLSVEVSETGGSAGQLESWSVEFCADINSVPPSIVNSSVTEVPPLGRNSIAKDKLRVESSVFSSGDVLYTLTALPEAGFLTLYGRTLRVGDTFDQSDINGNGLFYENTDEVAVNDDFGFVVTTPDGGYLPVTYHDILITEDAVVSNEERNPLAASLRVFPNPVNDQLNVRWDTEEARTLSVILFDLNGRALSVQRIPSQTGTATVDTSQLPGGVYLLRVDGAVRRIVKQ